MNHDGPTTVPLPSSTSLLRTSVLALPMAVLTFVMLSGGRMPADPKRLWALILSFAFFNILFFLMVHTGKTDKYRAPLFITYAVCFVISFISHLIEVRGSMAISQANIIQGETPFCHLVIPMTLIPAALTKTIIFPGTMIGSYASIASMFVLWIGASLALGRGFCSWGCFFGGLEEGFSRVFKKPLWKKINLNWTYFPYALLLVVVLLAAIFLSPFYCTWLCPFKTVTEFVEVTTLKILVQTIIFISLFIALVVVLPLLTKRRTQCAFFCPFGAFQSFTNKVNPFEVRIDPDQCVKCKRCLNVCPTFSVDAATLDQGKTRLSCMKCGRCIDSCAKGAISYHVKGTSLVGNLRAYRLLFLYPAFLFLATMAGGSMQDTIAKIIRLITTGSMI